MKLEIKSYGRMGDAVFNIEYKAETVGELIEEIVNDIKDTHGEVFVKHWDDKFFYWTNQKLISYGSQSWTETNFLTENIKKEKIKKVQILRGSIYDDQRDFVIEI
ncbi:MAG: hypothetical protein J1F35_05990 [Erysipelotrichales bacterium]|nr:hypothetical protein [Erysipelotrichales bacterium]